MKRRVYSSTWWFAFLTCSFDTLAFVPDGFTTLWYQVSFFTRTLWTWGNGGCCSGAGDRVRSWWYNYGGLLVWFRLRGFSRGFCLEGNGWKWLNIKRNVENICWDFSLRENPNNFFSDRPGDWFNLRFTVWCFRVWFWWGCMVSFRWWGRVGLGLGGRKGR